jgi:hypothetical protein
MKTKGSMVRERQLQTSSRIRLIMYIDDNEGTLITENERLRGMIATENERLHGTVATENEKLRGTVATENEKLRGTVATENIRRAVYIVYIDRDQSILLFDSAC